MFNKTQYNSLIKKEMKRLNDKINATDMDYSEDEYDSFEAKENMNTSMAITPITTLSDKLQLWYGKYKPPAECVNELLQILNDEGLNVMIVTNNSAVTASEEVAVHCDVDSYLNNYKEQQSDDGRTKRGGKARTIKKEISKENTPIIGEILEQQKQMNAKINIMMREIAKVNVRIDENEGISNTVNRTASIFPIDNVTALAEFEKSIDDDNTNPYVASLKRLINNDSINKCIVRILSKEILLEHNLDGRMKKLALNAYPKFLNLLFNAFDSKFETFPEFTWGLKLAMKRVKNRYHKANCINRKNISNLESDPLLFIKHNDSNFF